MTGVGRGRQSDGDHPQEPLDRMVDTCGGGWVWDCEGSVTNLLLSTTMLRAC